MPNPEREDAVGPEVANPTLEERVRFFLRRNYYPMPLNQELPVLTENDLRKRTRELLSVLDERSPEREDVVGRVVDFLDAWRYCPVSSSANAARECLEKAAHELLDSIPVVPKSALLAAQQRAEEAERERDEAMETPTAALDAVLIERMQIAEAQRNDYKARVEELESALREARALIDSEVDNATEAALNADRAASVIDAAL